MRISLAAVVTVFLIAASCDAPPPTEPLAPDAPSLARGGGVAGINGSGSFADPLRDGWRTLTVQARASADGTVRGSFRIDNRSEGLLAQPLSGSVICLTVQGNVAGVVALVERSTDGIRDGWYFSFEILDDGNNDLDSRGYLFHPSDLANYGGDPCNLPPADAWTPVEAGNYRVWGETGGGPA